MGKILGRVLRKLKIEFHTSSNPTLEHIPGQSVSHSIVSNFLWLLDCSPWLLCPWNSPCENTGVGCHFLLQGNFLSQGSNPGLLHCRQTQEIHPGCSILPGLSFLLKSSISWYGYSTICSTYCFQFGALTNKTTINICVQIFMWT